MINLIRISLIIASILFFIGYDLAAYYVVAFTGSNQLMDLIKGE